MKRVVDRGEIDHENGGVCRETVGSKCALFAEKLRMIRNPYTGNKRKLLVNLFTTIESYGKKYNTFLDLFTGRGSSKPPPRRAPATRPPLRPSGA